MDLPRWQIDRWKNHWGMTRMIYACSPTGISPGFLWLEWRCCFTKESEPWNDCGLPGIMAWVVGGLEPPCMCVGFTFSLSVALWPWDIDSALWTNLQGHPTHKYALWCDMIWCDMILIWYDDIWCDAICYDTMWYDMRLFIPIKDHSTHWRLRCANPFTSTSTTGTTRWRFCEQRPKFQAFGFFSMFHGTPAWTTKKSMAISGT